VRENDEIRGLPIWEKRADETQKAWTAFRCYRDAGRGRSIRKTANNLDVSRQNLEQWSVRYEWQRRVEAFDDFTYDEELRDFKQLQVALGQIQLQEIAHVKQLALTRIRAASDREIGSLSLAEAARIVERTVKMERELLALDDHAFWGRYFAAQREPGH
jgi:hypothetical protein